MNEEIILELVKAKEGITSTIRDNYIKHIIKGSIDELEKIKGIKLDENNNSHLLFVVDFAHYRYASKDNPVMPRNLQFRLHDLQVKSLGDNSNVVE